MNGNNHHAAAHSHQQAPGEKIGAGYVLSIAMLVLACLLTVGVRTFLRPCGIHEDGSYGACHWAGQAIFGLGLLMIAQALIMTAAKKRGSRLGLALSLALTALLTALVPGGLISLCKMETMRCRLVMQPAVRIISGLILLLACGCAYVSRERCPV